MARSEARLLVEIWDDEDFLARSAGAQRLFMFLLSQRDLAHTGVLALRERRWAGRAAGLTAEAVTDSLAELESSRFVVVDEGTEEVLLRSFMRRDRVYKQPNVLRAACDHLPMISSALILAALRVELKRIAAADDLGPKSAPIVEEMLAAIAERLPDPPDNRNGNPSDSPLANPSRNPSGNPSGGAPGERGVLRSSSSDSPVPGSPDLSGTASLKGSGRGHSSAPPPDDSSPKSMTETLLAEHCAKQRRPPPASQRSKIAAEIYALLANEPDPFSPDEVRATLEAWSKRPVAPSVIGSIADELFCRKDPPVLALDRQRAFPAGRSGSGGTDANLSGHAALVAELQAAEGGRL